MKVLKDQTANESPSAVVEVQKKINCKRMFAFLHIQLHSHYHIEDIQSPFILNTNWYVPVMNVCRSEGRTSAGCYLAGSRLR